MELREFQKAVMNHLSDFLVALEYQKQKYQRLISIDPELADDYLYPKKAWEQTGRGNYTTSFTGIGQPVADVYIKVPTGGGKTLMACHAIDQINRILLKKRTGMVLWVVPTKQIYSQTLKALRDKDHPYRQVLDIASGGQVKVFEKLQNFSREDVEANLCILLLMLPSAARQSKEVLKIFKDNSGYTSFFPVEDAFQEQEALLASTPNLDTFADSGYVFDKLPLTSLGNVLKILRPVTVIDEGHKAYSQTARDTILGFNPSFILELSATPPKDSNKVAEVSGRELNDEQMIKLDLHLTNKTTVGWRETLTDSVARRTSLEQDAQTYQQNTDVYIRPIALIQVERTGRDQRNGALIHAEDVKKYLINQQGIPERHIAIKSSDKDDIENVDLLSKDCDVRYIITKQALQEGWDCPFAYVLCVLTKAQSEVAMTQLIGRILRQPYAKKTGVRSLDESYLYSFQHDTSKLVHGIKKNLEAEGLGDIAGRIAVDLDDESNPDFEPTVQACYRESFKTYKGKILLPVFAMQDGEKWRELSYTQDLLSKVDWSLADLALLNSLNLASRISDDEIRSIGYSGDSLQSTRAEEVSYKSELDAELLTRQLLDVVPNPWVAFEISNAVFTLLLARFDQETIASNLVFITEELRKHLFHQRDLLAEKVFRNGLESGQIKFYLLKGSPLARIPNSATYRSRKRLTRTDGSQLEKSLFDYVPSESVNGLEEEVAVFLDGQEKILWWYRNLSQADYRIQGWKPNRIYPDFLAANEREGSVDTVYVLETKGDQLSGSADTEYKRDLLAMCSRLSISKSWTTLEFADNQETFRFKMIDQKSWKNQLNALFA